MELNLAALAALPLFAGLSDAELTTLRPMLHRRTFPAGTPLLATDQWGEVAFIIEDGTVKVHNEQANGKDVILAILGPGEVVGELSILDRGGRSANVVTVTTATLLWINRPELETCLQTLPTMTLNLARILARRLRMANAQLQSLATKDVFGRVAYLLLAFAAAYGKPGANGDLLIPLHLTQTELASLVGASRVRVNHVIGFYKDRHYISVDRNYHITVHDQPALAQRCA
ncbi:MAG: cAMP-activated global transcriptional regulator CRP [Herpetosiphon sp.]